mgnify:CR=1 FL=1
MCKELYASCNQCPRKCNANRTQGKSGFCGETDEVRIALACLHFGEEPLITVHGGSGTIFLTGCTLRCAFCQNYQISQNGMGKAVSSAEFSEICLRLQNAGAENINLVTGSHAIPRLAEYIAAAQKAGCTIPFCWNSSAYERPELLELLKPYVKIWLPDLKTLDSTLSKTLFDAADYPQAATTAIDWMIKNFPMQLEDSPALHDYTNGEGEHFCKGTIKEKMTQGVIVRHLFLPGKFMQTADTLDWLKEHADGKACISLMNQYTPVPFAEEENRNKKRRDALSAIENRLVSSQEDMDLQDLIEAYDFDFLFYQELSDDTSWLPDFSRAQPFSNKLSTVLWHWNHGFLN